MAVVGSNLLAPEGPVEPDLFPGEYEDGGDALMERLNAYASQATTLAANYSFDTVPEEDAAITAYALHLVFKAAYTLAIARPAEDDADSAVLGRTEFKQDQREALKEERDRYFDEWVALLPVPEGGSPAAEGLSSYQTSQTYDW